MSMFGSYEESVDALKVVLDVAIAYGAVLREDAALPTDADYLRNEGRIAGIREAIDVIREAWKEAESVFAAHCEMAGLNGEGGTDL